MRTIKKIHQAESRPIGDLKTVSPLPSRQLDQIDPFLFLNHHGPQHYGPNNHGLPFGPHPHRGMETVTFIVEGDIAHKDSGGHESVIDAGGVQWMTAGSGLIHSEVSSKKFLEKGGDLEILQLWLNLPADLKMSQPKYTGLQKDKIPFLELEEGKIKIDVVSGAWNDTQGAFESVTGVNLFTISLKKGAELIKEIPAEHNVFFYVIRGKLQVNGKSVDTFQLAEFENDHEEIKIEASEDSLLLLGHAPPIGEPVVAYGPFVMNTEEEIRQAYADYQAGKFGSWTE